MGFAVHSQCFVSVAPSFLHYSPALVWGPSHRIQSFTNCSNVGPPHELQFFKNCSSMRLFHGYSPSGMDCSSVGSSLQATVHARSLSLCGLSTDCSFLQDTSTCFSVGFSMDHRLDICSTMVLLGQQGDNLHHCGPPWAAGGQLASLWSSPWAAGESLPSAWSTSSSFFTDFGVCRAIFLTFSHSSLLVLLCSTFSPFLNMFSQRHCFTGWLNFGQWQVHLRAGQNWVCQTWGQLLVSSDRIHPAAPPLPKSWHVNSVQLL